MPSRAVPGGDLILATAFAAAGIGAAALFYLGGDPCKSSARIEWLYVAPFLLGAASFGYATHASSRWSVRLVSSLLVVLVSGGALFVIAIIQWGANCYT
jgi:hypothetical protein